MQRRHQRGSGGLAPQEKIGPVGGAVARVFLNVSLAMCPLKFSLAPYLLDVGASTDIMPNHQQEVSMLSDGTRGV